MLGPKSRSPRSSEALSLERQSAVVSGWSYGMIDSAIFEYYTKVVPTSYVPLDRAPIHVYQLLGARLQTLGGSDVGPIGQGAMEPLLLRPARTCWPRTVARRPQGIGSSQRLWPVALAPAVALRAVAAKWQGKRLRKSNKAQRLWGGGLRLRQDGLALRPQAMLEEDLKVKWKPKRENWQAWVTDELEAFGSLAVGHEVELFTSSWTQGVVTQLASGRAKVALSTGKTELVDLGEGRLRRSEDAQELCDPEMMQRMAKLRSMRRCQELMAYGLQQSSVGNRSQAIFSLARMGREGLGCAEEMLSQLGPTNVASTTIRELCHSHARLGELRQAVQHVDVFDDVHAAQLLVEVLALGLTATILREREKLSENFLQGVESNEEVREAVQAVIDLIPKLGGYASDVRRLPFKTRSRCFTEAFNELLLSCGRAHAVKVSFRVLEWMEALAIPKDSFTYEACIV